MDKNPRTIAKKISELLDELVVMAEAPTAPSKSGTASKKDKKPIKGAAGALHMLIEEGYFKTPKELRAIMDRLKEVGHYHSQETVSMNLLNLKKRRILNRFENKESKKWEYVTRK